MLCYFILLSVFSFQQRFQVFFCLFMVLKQNAVNPTASGSCDVVFPVIKEYGFDPVLPFYKHKKTMSRPCRAEISSCGWTADTYAPHSSTEYTDGIPVLSGFLPNLQRMASVPPRHQDYHIPSALLFLIPVHFSESLPRFLPLKLSRGRLLPPANLKRTHNPNN